MIHSAELVVSWKELDLASEVSLTPKELQKYLAQMHAHRMVRKCATVL